MITLKVNDTNLSFEHSLISLSEWESEYEKPFFSPRKEDEKTEQELLAYFECMLVSNRKYRHLVRLLNDDQKIALANYINKPRTATTVREMPGQKKGPTETVTSELIYYWMISFKIPFSPTETWHLNRLLMLVKVAGIKAGPAQKSRTSRKDLAMSMREINEQRRKESGSKG